MSYAAQVETGSGISPVGSSLYGVCTSAASEQYKTVTLDNFDTLLDGTTIHVKFTYSNTAANAELAFGSTASMPIIRYGTTSVGTTEATSWKANSVVSLTYDKIDDETGYWRMNDAGADEGIITMITNETSARSSAVTSLQNQINTINATLLDKENKALVFTNKSATFSSGSGITNFRHCAAVACEGATAGMIPYVAFAGNDAGSGNYSTYCQSYDGGVYVYAAVSGTITIPTIIFWRP